MSYISNTFLFFFLLVTLSSYTMKDTDATSASEADEMNTIQLAENLKIAYTDSEVGDEILLFVHGLGSNHKAWNKNILVLKKHFRCIAIDLPGYGQSSTGDFDYSMSFFSDVVRKFIDKKRLDKVHLVGHSMGGQISISTTLKHPDIVKSLILIAPAGIETFEQSAALWLKSVFSYDLLVNLSKEQIIQNFEINFYDMPEDARFMIDERFELMELEAYHDYCRMIPKCVSGMLDEPVFDQLDQVEQSVLILYGKEDRLIPNTMLHPQKTTQLIAKKADDAFPNSEMHLISQAGHFLQWEKSNEVNAVIKNFLFGQ